ncbi:hypothetical protein [Micromonospora sp. NPDC048169]|uniref:hypothetical protein n=1 Tax=Micromonospora sp. NPDC048169 TaxID=3154711 RepID=UPI0033C42859
MSARAWIGKRLRFLADRIDYKGAPRYLGYSVTIETDESVPRIREDGRGCKLWYLGNAEYEKAHTEADSAEEDARREKGRQLILTAMTDPDPVKAGQANAEWWQLIQQDR